MLLIATFTIIVAPVLAAFIYWLLYGRPWNSLAFTQMSTLHLEKALRQYDDFLILILFQHQTILNAVKAFGEGIDNSCVLVGSAFEGCFLPRNLIGGRNTGVEFDFFLRLPTLCAAESTSKLLQYVQINSGTPHQFILNVLNPSIKESALKYLSLEYTTQKSRNKFIKECKSGNFLTDNFFKALEKKVQNSLEKVLVEKPGGMELVSRLDAVHGGTLQASLTVSFFKSILERLDMLPLDPDTWAGDATTNLQMLWVNLTNWSLSFWQTRIFKVHLVIECEWPQDIRQNWLQRKRSWPSEKIVQEVARLPCYLHPLWKTNNLEDTLVGEVQEFEMTFGTAECLLFSETGPKERHCIVVLKALKEKYFSSSHILSSFVIKTVFFWVLQSTPLSERQNMGRGEHLDRILNRLIAVLEERNLPHFFTPNVNLLQRFERSDIENTLIQLRTIKDKALNFLSFELFRDKCPTTLTEDFVEKVLGFL